MIGGPVLDGHRSGTTSDQLGVVEKAEIRPEGLWVQLRFRSSEAAQQVTADISDGTLRALSVGYTVSEWLDGREGKNRTRTAKKWTLLEVSIVTMPADPGAHFRNGDGPMSQQEQITEQQDQGDVMTRAQMNAEKRRSLRRSPKGASSSTAPSRNLPSFTASTPSARSSASRARR
ncbi:HK97 family phage prohead protease [Fluviibacterium sp. DFM31]|uniref:HK97 family phage prohead protease n=1 Tax=Meridianimarinicoccus marinus TaxID=3231483 RepID=A0ABV3L3D3_9RHOB